VAPALTRLGLDGRLATTRAAALSAGQRRRTSLAALVARGAELWLLDEPHAGLDENGRDLIDGIVHDAVGSGSTVLMASHDTDRATALSTRVATVAGGMITEAVRVP
jgi:energy-coupling factor transporter ATP-binding protein EcfA2